jgi:membrane protein implicated in regulation of membrane protease activity
MTASTAKGWGKVDWLRRGLLWAADRIDPLAALVGGLAAAIVGTVGAAKGDTLATATLAVLTVVALSLLRERSSRISLRSHLDDVLEQVGDTRLAVKAIESARSYHVMLDETTWDLQGRGEVAYATRRKRLRFVQDEVITVVDWFQGDGKSDIEYPLGKPVHSFKADGRACTLIALDRFYGRGEELDFLVKRTARDAFPGNPDRAAVVTLDQVSVLRMTVKWSVERPPTAVRLRRMRADGVVQVQNVTDQLTCLSERSVYTVTVDEPERGGRTSIEWDW